MTTYWQKCLSLYRSGRPLVFYDTETTGLINPGQPLPLVWQLGVARTGPNEVRREGKMTINIGMPIPAAAILRPDVKPDRPLSGRPPLEVLPRFTAFIDGAILVGHNIDRFDSILMADAYRRAGLPVPPLVLDHTQSLDTLQLAWKIFPPRGEPGCPPNGFSLGALCVWLGIEVRELHDALDDVRACEKLLPALIRATEAIERKAASASASEENYE